MKLTIILIILGLISHLFPPIIKANTVLLIDQFEREKISPWQVVQNEGSGNWDHCLDVLSPAQWQIVSGWMKLVVDGISCTLVITPTPDNLITAPNWQVDFDWRLDESIIMDRNFVWWWQDENNWYDLKLYGTGINVQKVINGVSQNLNDSHSTFPFLANEVYHFTIKYQSQNIKVIINGQEVINTTDHNPLISQTKTVALKTSLGSKRSVSSFDNLQVTSLPITATNELPVPLLKQIDQKWSELEYDKAQLWATNPTIARWGCALASTAMIMRYHQLNFLPDGQEITPASLNTWLQSQVDGYIGEGLLNWLAISRLSAEINKKYGTPKLEYQRVSEVNFIDLAKNFEKNLPLIFNIEGHFLVATGYNTEDHDFSILDPFYFFTFFSQHQKELLSARLFTPSYTDLSYLMFVTPEDINLDIKSDQNENLEIEQFIEKIIDPVSAQVTSKKITQIKKPKSAKYSFAISNQSDNMASINFYAYNTSGEFITDNFQLEKNNTQNREINFDPDSAALSVPILVSTNEINHSWLNFKQLLLTYYLQPTGKYWPIFDYLNEITTDVQSLNTSEQITFKEKMIDTINRTPMPTEVSTNLLKALNSLNLVI